MQIAIGVLTPFNQTLRLKMYKNKARSRLFCRIAKRSIIDLLAASFLSKLFLGNKLDLKINRNSIHKQTSIMASPILARHQNV